MKISIRTEQFGERHQCETLVRDAFWDLYRPGCVEHLILHQARTSPDLVLNLVAEADEELLGSLVATRARIVTAEGLATEVLYLGPLAVRPDLQGRGIGSQLISHGLATATNRGFSSAFLFGDPGYYHRFGFQNAATWAVTTADGLNFEAFMGIELRPNALEFAAGRLQESPCFEVDPAVLVEFDQGFPPREQHVLPGQFG